MTIYSKEGCPQCEILKKRLTSKGLEFKESTNYNDFKQHGFKTLPIMKVNNEFLDYYSSIQHIGGLT